MLKVVLASSSKQRQDILNMVGLEYEIMTSSVEEYSDQTNPGKYVEELSFNKALSVSKELKEKAIIIAADTIIYCNNKIYEKPKSKEQVYKNLNELSGKVNQAYTGLTIIDLYQNKILSCFTVTGVKFKNIENSEIEWYVNSEEEMYKCCGYSPLGKVSIFIESISGDYNNLLGLSPNVMFSKLRDLGYSIMDFEYKTKE